MAAHAPPTLDAASRPGYATRLPLSGLDARAGDVLVVLALEDEPWLSRTAWREKASRAGIVDDRGRQITGEAFKELAHHLVDKGVAKPVGNGYTVAGAWLAPVLDDAERRGRLRQLADALARTQSPFFGWRRGRLGVVADLRFALASGRPEDLTAAERTFADHEHGYGVRAPSTVAALGLHIPSEWIARQPVGGNSHFARYVNCGRSRSRGAEGFWTSFSLVRSQSFAEAGRRSGLAKSAISQRVTRLEERLRVQLLRRSTRRISLTEQGLRLYEHAAALLEVKELASRTIEATRSEVGGRVRLNAPASLPRRLIVGALRSFTEAHPEVRVELTLDDRIVELVESPDDLVLRLTIVEDQGFVARRLVRDRVVVAGAPSYLSRRGRPERPEDLLRHDCLRRTGMRARDEWRFGRPGARYSVPVSPRFETSDAVALREAALSGMGLLVAPSLTIAEHVRAGRLETVLEGFIEDEVGLFAITPARRLASPAVGKLVDHLARTFGKRDVVLPDPRPGNAT